MALFPQTVTPLYTTSLSGTYTETLPANNDIVPDYFSSSLNLAYFAVFNTTGHVGLVYDQEYDYLPTGQKFKLAWWFTLSGGPTNKLLSIARSDNDYFPGGSSSGTSAPSWGGDYNAVVSSNQSGEISIDVSFYQAPWSHAYNSALVTYAVVFNHGDAQNEAWFRIGSISFPDAYGNNLRQTVATTGLTDPLFGSTAGETNPADTESPVITLTGDANITLTQGDTYTEQGATWTDNVDGSGDAVVTGSVDTSTVGTYTITYNYTDAAGNVATEVSRTVVVSEVSEPPADPTTTVTILDSGSGYTESGTDVPTTGGSGTGLKVNYDVDGDGGVTGVTVTDDGTGYQDDDEVEIPGGTEPAVLLVNVVANTNSILFKIGRAIKDAKSEVQASIPDYLDGSGGSTGTGGGTTDGGYDDFLSGFGAGDAPSGGGTGGGGTGGGGGTDPEPEPTTFSANVDTSTSILASSPTNPDGEVTIQYATDTEDLYVYDGGLWTKFEND